MYNIHFLILHREFNTLNRGYSPGLKAGLLLIAPTDLLQTKNNYLRYVNPSFLLSCLHIKASKMLLSLSLQLTRLINEVCREATDIELHRKILKQKKPSTQYIFLNNFLYYTS